MTAVLPSPAPPSAADGGAARRCRPAPWRRAWRKLAPARGAMFGLAVVARLHRRWRCSPPWLAPLRSDRDQLERDPQAAVGRALVRHRRDRPRRASRASSGARARRCSPASSRSRSRSRSACRSAWRRASSAAVVDAADLAPHRRLPRLPVPDPGDRAGRLPRPEPHQRDDRDRRLGDADLRAADPRRR